MDGKAEEPSKRERASQSADKIPTSCVPAFLIKSMVKTHTGGCYCGAVEIEVRGEPLEMGYCHCENCRRYSAAPVSAFTLWKWEDVNLIKGAEFLGKFKSSDISDRVIARSAAVTSRLIIRRSV
jgi:hypothetical protein